MMSQEDENNEALTQVLEEDETTALVPIIEERISPNRTAEENVSCKRSHSKTAHKRRSSRKKRKTADGRYSDFITELHPVVSDSETNLYGSIYDVDGDVKEAGESVLIDVAPVMLMEPVIKDVCETKTISAPPSDIIKEAESEAGNNGAITHHSRFREVKEIHTSDSSNDVFASISDYSLNTSSNYICADYNKVNVINELNALMEQLSLLSECNHTHPKEVELTMQSYSEEVLVNISDCSERENILSDLKVNEELRTLNNHILKQEEIIIQIKEDHKVCQDELRKLWGELEEEKMKLSEKNTQLVTLQHDNEYLRTENVRLKNANKVELSGLDNIVGSHENNEYKNENNEYKNDVCTQEEKEEGNVGRCEGWELKDDAGEKEPDEECCCCSTFVRGMSKINQQLKGMAEQLQPVSEPFPTNADISSSTNITETSTKRYKWEDHSAGKERIIINKMGFKGKGLGKDENGIEEALTVNDLSVLSMDNNLKTTIFSSSITRGIRPNGFNKSYKKGVASFERFPGRTAEDIRLYIPAHLQKEHPKRVVIVASGNGVPTGKYSNISAAEIAEGIIEAGRVCARDCSMNGVYITSILPRQSFYFQLRRKEINDILKEECRINGFIFIDNKDIILSEHVAYDGVHLNFSGSALLCKNLLYHLNKEA